MMLVATFYQYDESPSVLPFLLVCSVIGAILFLYLRHMRGRAAAMRKLAEREGFDFLGTALPAQFPRKLLDDLYAGWLIPRWEGPRNVVRGVDGDELMLAFDVTVHRGKSHYRRTVVALRSAKATPKTTVGERYLYRSTGDWQMVTPQSNILSIPRLITPRMIVKLWERLR